MLPRRKPPTSLQPVPMIRPASGSPTPVYSSQAARGSGAGGTPNSSEASVPPERTTRASSASVAPGSSTYRSRYVTVSASKAPVLERQLLGAPFDEADVLRRGSERDPATRLLQHLRALVDPDDRAALLPDELERDGARSGGDVEHDVPGARLDPFDEEAAPARVLPEREQPCVPVVGRAERREELASRSRARRCGLGHRNYSRKGGAP